MSGSSDRGAIEAAWLSLLSLPSMGPRRLWDIAAVGDPVGEWQRLSVGATPRAFAADAERRALWRSAAAAIDPGRIAAHHAAARVALTLHGDADHPSLELHDPHVPPVLLWRGDGRYAQAGAVSAPRVGMVGTRRASRAGLDVAQEFASELSRAGCTVVSGLALGIDAAAHRGALSVARSTPVGVVGSGLDVVYPRANRDLWADVGEAGALCSEYPLGTAPAAWRFPARNRILVALCDALVVIESHERGGSLITAGIAGERGVPVLAVPGALRSPTSRGTNRLIADGCQPCLGVEDVLTALGLASPPQLPFGRPDGERVHDTTAPDDPAESVLLDALGWSPRSVDELADACPALGLGELSVALASLLGRGVVAERDGRVERVR